MGVSDGLVHQEIMELEASPAQIRAFTMDPDRILDYYPAPLEGGVFEPGRSIWCRGEGSVAMLELLEDESTHDCVVVLCTIAAGLEPPYAPGRIRASATLTMVEEWALAPSSAGTTVTKSWRDVRATEGSGVPLYDAIRETAKVETQPLIERWNEAARAAI
ncbi:MAG TPA: hypothetical protein VFV02_06910 [Acidimicrobiales bacterium]|nr:hypothetical protein [Acidimicrobiales bacterium]